MIHKLAELFIAFFKVGLLSFGGGYALIPLIEQQVVEAKGWVTHDEFIKVLGASLAIPGAISIKFATYIGYKEAGIIGIMTTIIGSFIVPIAAILVLLNLNKTVETFPAAQRALKGITSATWGLIIGFGINSLTKTGMDFKNIAVGAIALIATAIFKISPPFIIIASGVVGFLIYR